MSSLGGRRSIQHDTRCFTASKPITPRSPANAAAWSSASILRLEQRQAMQRIEDKVFPVIGSDAPGDYLGTTGDHYLEDWLEDISIEMDPEDGRILVWGTGEESITGFTNLDVENLAQTVEIYKADPVMMS